MEPIKPLPSPPKSSKPGEVLKSKAKRQSTSVGDDEFEFYHEFSRSNVKGLIHAITQELKKSGLNIEFLFLPFRPEQSNEKLLKFLNQVFPLGNGVPVNAVKQDRIIAKTEPWTLFQALKYIWCRLPDAQVITWKAYKAFKSREESDGFRAKSFLELMPKCLSSPDHASIVYDFFDLIVATSSNSKHNKMSARKISKMFGIWAFGKDANPSNTTNYDFDMERQDGLVQASFKEGIDQWIPASDAMFHLLLAFIRSFVPSDLSDANIPTSLKTILFNSDYPPKRSTAYDSETILTVPIVTLKTDKFSKKPWQLVERCNELFDFSKHENFKAREDYALLKSLFKKKNNIEGITHKMSRESRRIMKEISTKHSTFQAGWASQSCISPEEGVPLKGSYLEMGRVDIDDYFIWAWLSSLSHEQTSAKRKLFGRALVLEFEFDGFKKWVVLEECDLNLEIKLHKKMDALNYVKPEAKIDVIEEPSVRNITPAYEKFQKGVEEPEPSRTSSQSSSPAEIIPSMPGAMPLVKDQNHRKAEDKHDTRLNLKWNPLKSIRKKSSGSASSSSLSSPASKKDYVNDAKTKELPRRPVIEDDSTSNAKHRSRVLSQFSVLNPEKYQLPTIEQDDFKIEIPELDEESMNVQHDQAYQKIDSPVGEASGSIRDLSEMVDDLKNQVLKSNEINNKSERHAADLPETFETLTMFDRYKSLPVASSDTLAESSASSAVTPLELEGNNAQDGRVSYNEPNQTSPIVFPLDYDHRSQMGSPVQASNRPSPTRNLPEQYQKLSNNNTSDLRASPVLRSHHDGRLPEYVHEPASHKLQFPHHPSNKVASSPELTQAYGKSAQSPQMPTKDYTKFSDASPVPVYEVNDKPMLPRPDEDYRHINRYEEASNELSHPRNGAKSQVMPNYSPESRRTEQLASNAPYDHRFAASPTIKPTKYETQEASVNSNNIHGDARHNPHGIPFSGNARGDIRQVPTKGYNKEAPLPPLNPHGNYAHRHHGQHPQNQYARNPVPPNQYPQNQYHQNHPQNQSPQNQYHHSQIPYNQYPQNQIPQNQHLHGHYPRNQYPQNHVMAHQTATVLPQEAYRTNGSPRVMHSPHIPSNYPSNGFHGHPAQMHQVQNHYPPLQQMHNPSPVVGVPGVPAGGKLHGALAKKREDRKKLHDTIKNGAFGL